MNRNGQVQWEDLDAATYEDMCAVLVSRLHTDARRIERSGSDIGYDIMVPTARGPLVFQLKGFTGRMTSGRRRSVADSLRKTAESRHRPQAWSLVVPIDPTPAEEKWFRALTQDLPFECRWLGRSWLDDHIAAHPDIYRYYVTRSNDEIGEILRELAREQGALSRGEPGAVERMQALSRRLNSLDPHYAFGVALDENGVAAVSVWTRYPGAEYDRPVKLSASFRFPETGQGIVAAESLPEHTNLSIAAVVATECVATELDMPAGLGRHFLEAGSEPSSTEAVAPLDIRALLRLINENGRTVAQLPLHATGLTRGQGGGDLTMVDATGTFTAKIRFGVDARRLRAQFTYQRPDDALPTTLLPVLHFLAQYRPPNSAVFLINEQGAASPAPIEALIAEDLAAELALVEALDEIQRASGVYFIVPSVLTEAEVKDIRLAQRLLAGETIRDTWTAMTISSTAGALDSLRAAVERGPGPLVAEAELTVRIGEHVIPLGFTRQVLPTVVIAHWPTVPAGASPDLPVEITFQPGTDNSATTVLVKANDDRPGRAAPGRAVARTQPRTAEAERRAAAELAARRGRYPTAAGPGRAGAGQP